MFDLIKLLAIFALIVILLRRRINLGLVMLIAAVVLGLGSQLSVVRLLEIGAYTATQFSTINLIAALALIMFIENVMRHTQMLRHMVDSLSTLIGDRRIVMALLPAFMGFLPSAGGARFSAPMVDEVARDLPMSAETRSFVNYWYRHIWEYVFPLYPSVVMAAQIINQPISALMLANLPLMLTAVVIGIPVAFRGTNSSVNEPANERPARNRQHVFDLLGGISPIVGTMVLVIGLRLDISPALAIVLVILLIVKRYTPHMIVQMVREAFSLKILLLVFGVLLFKDVLNASGSVDNLRAYFDTQGIPPMLVMLVLPFFVGLLTGVTQAPVGVTFPIAVGLSASGVVDMRLIALAYASGFAGVMLSPTHLCLPLTTEHFKASTGGVLRMVALPEVVIVLVAVGFYVIR